MRYHKITSPDINNGTGFRVTLWLSGCSLNCKGCHNPETHSFLSGKEFTEEAKNELFEKLSKPYIKGLTLSGGNPFESSSEELLSLILEVKEKFPEKDIWAYSGFTLEECIDKPPLREILENIDVLVDGRFVLAKRDSSIAFRGSSNQIIWVKDKEGNFIKSDLN